MFRRTFLFALALAACAALSLAQEGSGKKQAKITGFLIDNACAATHGTDVQAKQHKTACALSPEGERSGFAVVSRNVVYKLDEQGSKLAHDILKESKTKKGLAVQVEGTLVGDTISVDSIAEVQP